MILKAKYISSTTQYFEKKLHWRRDLIKFQQAAARYLVIWTEKLVLQKNKCWQGTMYYQTQIISSEKKRIHPIWIIAFRHLLYIYKTLLFILKNWLEWTIILLSMFLLDYSAGKIRKVSKTTSQQLKEV